MLLCVKINFVIQPTPHPRDIVHICLMIWRISIQRPSDKVCCVGMYDATFLVIFYGQFNSN